MWEEPRNLTIITDENLVAEDEAVNSGSGSWRTYLNEEYGYRISYPPSWTVEEVRTAEGMHDFVAIYKREAVQPDRATFPHPLPELTIRIGSTWPSAFLEQEGLSEGEVLGGLSFEQNLYEPRTFKGIPALEVTPWTPSIRGIPPFRMIYFNHAEQGWAISHPGDAFGWHDPTYTRVIETIELIP